MKKIFKKFRHRLASFPSPLPLIFIATATVAVILYGRGYRIDFNKNEIKPTGLLSTTSDPIGAEVYINGILKTATNNSINIDPNWYTVKISKEGYIPWQKNLRVQGEIVAKTDAYLFLSNPNLSALTNTGVENPLLSPDGTKIAYTLSMINGEKIGNLKKAGLWIYELTDRPLGLNRDPKQLSTAIPQFDFSAPVLIWSPDSSQIMVNNQTGIRLYAINKPNEFEDVGASFQFILNDWKEQKEKKDREKLLSFKSEIVAIASSSTQIIAFSPDETKILYEATASATLPPIIVPPLIGTNPTEESRNISPGKLYVYDSREDKNYFVLDRNEIPVNQQPTTNNSNRLLPISWFPTSRHLLLILSGKIDIMEYDRTNWVTIYSGPFNPDFLSIWPNGSRLIVTTNLNPGLSTLLNLYSINVR